MCMGTPRMGAFPMFVMNTTTGVPSRHQEVVAVGELGHLPSDFPERIPAGP